MNASLLLSAMLLGQPGVEPPVAGRPRDWSGVVGGPFVVTATAEPTALTAEEPLALTVRIAVAPGGSAGNLRNLARPPLAKLEAFKPFAVENLDDRFSDNPPRREFRYHLRPRTAHVKEVPRVKFVYFNPRLPPGRGYQTTYSEEVALTVKPRPAVATAAESLDDLPGWLLERPSVDEILGRNRGPVARWIDAALGKLGIQSDAAAWLGRGGVSWPMVGLMLALPPAACAGWFVLWRRRNPTAARLAQVRRSRAAAAALRQIRADGADGARSVAAAVLGYLHDRLGAPAAATPAEVAAALASHGTSALTERTVVLLRACDEARFAPAPALGAELVAAAEQLILDWEAQAWSPPHS